jgi:site-specific recombinase XerD
MIKVYLALQEIEQLGHASFNTTARYRKVAGGELEEWYESLWRKGVKPGGT